MQINGGNRRLESEHAADGPTDGRDGLLFRRELNPSTPLTEITTLSSCKLRIVPSMTTALPSFSGPSVGQKKAAASTIKTRYGYLPYPLRVPGSRCPGVSMPAPNIFFISKYSNMQKWMKMTIPRIWQTCDNYGQLSEPRPLGCSSPIC